MESRSWDLPLLKWGRLLVFISLCIFILTCKENKQVNKKSKPTHRDIPGKAGAYLIVLGTLQDGGSPHIGCKKDCCKDLFENPDPKRKVVSIGLVDAKTRQTWLIEATPDIAAQLKMLKRISKFQETEVPAGIFLTHAHLGHYAGLAYLGKEAMGAKNVPVYVMPRMKTYLERNGPWSQLVEQKNISLQPLKDETTLKLSSNFTITPFIVPHRDEFSETVGYKIKGPSKTVLFIPDINKWEIWGKKIREEITKVDYAFIDATFYDGDEINTRNISEIPHPFVIESIELFKNMPAVEKNKIYFIHFNHTNPLIDPKSKQSELVTKQGFHIARPGEMINM